MSQRTDTPSIRSNELRGFHSDVSDLVMELVNHYEVRWRRGQSGSVLLYPPDGHTQPIKVSQRRPPQQQMQYLLEWSAEHLSQRKVTDEKIVALAKAKNSAEHPVEEQPVTTTEAPKNDTEVTLMIPDRSGQTEREGNWRPYETADGRLLDTIETDGEWFRCVKCKDTDEPFVSPTFYGANGHVTSKHGRAQYSPEAQAKRVDSTRYNRLVESIKDPLLLIVEALDLDTSEKAVKTAQKEIDRLESQHRTSVRKIKALEEELQKSADKHKDLTKKYEEVEARLALIQEAFRA